jgi:hypothetical protein
LFTIITLIIGNIFFQQDFLPGIKLFFISLIING